MYVQQPFIKSYQRANDQHSFICDFTTRYIKNSVL
jgi:hypothetical protein